MNNTLPSPSRSLPKFFDFASREAQLYEVWEKSGVFKPESNPTSTSAFSIALPPPNANGELHLGHCFGETIIDVLGRFHRLRGEKVLLIPGKDHAGIQTQVVYEKLLRKEGIDPTQLTSEELYRRCYEFCINRSSYMRAQEKMLGLSADWDRELFTLDSRLSDVIFDTFKKLWEEGLVYRGTRIVNWSVLCQTSISDVEVEYKDTEGGFWFIRYPLEKSGKEIRSTHRFSFDEVVKGEGASLLTSTKHDTLAIGEIVEVEGQEVSHFAVYKIARDATVLLPLYVIEGALIAGTTRPETMLGDTALAVHPKDPRYTQYVGEVVQVPLTGRSVKVIADARVDPLFGTGVVKVTPAHDFTDFDIGQDHTLEILQVIGKDGRMTESAGPEFFGLTASECRLKVTELLQEKGYLHAQMIINHKVPVGERGKDVIEPLLSQQWFLAVDSLGNSLKQRALDMLRSGKITVYPSRASRLIEQWLVNLRDWNISRQLWWGHRIPVWYRDAEVVVSKEKPEGEGWVPESDTFDTWFSSGQWPFSTAMALGLMEGDMFPTHTMVMGRDILFFWACRMLLLTTYRMEDLPWKNIFFHGLVLDEHGQKMSKSKGNGIEPKYLVDKYGTDALRLALLLGTTSGNDLRLHEKKVEGYSKFINKLWNAAKLIELKTGGAPTTRPHSLSLASSRWILSELKRCHAQVSALLSQYEISMAGEHLYSFIWGEFCDWYLEMCKVLLEHMNPQEQEEVRYVVVEVLEQILILLHPFAPFVTEEIYQSLECFRGRGLLAAGRWERAWALEIDSQAKSSLDDVKEFVSSIRSVKSALNITHKVIPSILPCELPREETILVERLARVMTAVDKIDEAKLLRKPTSKGPLALQVEDKESYRSRLDKELSSLKNQQEQIERKLGGAFSRQAKAELVAAEKLKLEEVRMHLSTLENELTLLR